MNITKRLYTYPVLADDKNDYKNSKFNVDVESRMNGVNYIHLSFDICMNDIELQKLILSGEIEYIIHIECPTTAYRETIHTIIEHIEKDIPIGRINGKLELTALIVAKHRIKKFECKDWDEDYEGLSFSLEKGSIIGYQNLPAMDIVKNYEELVNAGSIFLVQKRLSDDSVPMNINIDSSQIKLGLGTKEYEVYSKFCGKTKFQPILNAMIIFPALVYVFEELKQETGIEENEGKAWFVSLVKAYEKRGIDFVKEVREEDKSSMMLAQEAMELPLTQAFSAFTDLFDSEEEES